MYVTQTYMYMYVSGFELLVLEIFSLDLRFERLDLT